MILGIYEMQKQTGLPGSTTAISICNGGCSEIAERADGLLCLGVKGRVCRFQKRNPRILVIQNQFGCRSARVEVEVSETCSSSILQLSQGRFAVS